MSDEIMAELWRIKDGIAREHGYDVETLAAHLQSEKPPDGQQVVDLRAIKGRTQRDSAADTDKPRR